MKFTEEYWEMPDGVKLCTAVYLPDNAKKCPIIFIRTPYKEYPNRDFSKYINAGYAVICQDCRGTLKSEGECHPYIERDDGLTTLEYIRKLPFYQEEIYITGASYLSTVHLSYLYTNPHDIKGAALSIQTDRMYFKSYRNGCNRGFLNYHWWMGMLERRYPNQTFDDFPKRPYKNLAKNILGEDDPEFTKRMMHTEFDEFWSSDPRNYSMDNLQIPILLTEGWYDFYIEGMFAMWDRIPEETKKKSAMMVGAWEHNPTPKPSENKIYSMPNGDPLISDLDFFESIRNKKTLPNNFLGNVNYYSFGGDFWAKGCASKSIKRLYFSKGKLTYENSTGSESYTYNPDERLGYFEHDNLYIAKPLCDNILCFESEEFSENTNFYGQIRWHMNVSSDCEDTVFYIRTYMVENEKAYNLADTITSISHINKNYKPNEKLLIDLPLPYSGFTIKKGCKIRVCIASDSNIYVPHSNTKEHWAEATKTKIATNTVYYENSFIELPIV